MMIKSPLNYIGGKYRILPQILPLFPQRIAHFVDLFAGGLDVSLNVEALHMTCNDINHHLMAMYQYIQSKDISDLLKEINANIVTTIIDIHSCFSCLPVSDLTIRYVLIIMESSIIRLERIVVRITRIRSVT